MTVQAQRESVLPEESIPLRLTHLLVWMFCTSGLVALLELDTSADNFFRAPQLYFAIEWAIASGLVVTACLVLGHRMAKQGVAILWSCPGYLINALLAAQLAAVLFASVYYKAAVFLGGSDGSPGMAGVLLSVILNLALLALFLFVIVYKSTKWWRAFFAVWATQQIVSSAYEWLLPMGSSSRLVNNLPAYLVFISVVLLLTALVAERPTTNTCVRNWPHWSGLVVYCVSGISLFVWNVVLR